VKALAESAVSAQKKDLLADAIASGSFGRHETFHLRTGWLRKGFRAIQEKGGDFFASPQTTEELGVGKNMVNAIRYWCQACSVLSHDRAQGRSALMSTPLAELIFGFPVSPGKDPYLEDPATDWVLHYELVTNPKLAPLFFWAFNFFGGHDFNRDGFTAGLLSYCDRASVPVDAPERIIRNDYSAFLRTYGSDNAEARGIKLDILDSPFGHLGLLASDAEKSMFRFKLGSKANLPARVIAYSIIRMLQREREFLSDEDKPSLVIEGSHAIALDKLLWAPFSPGMIFKLDGESLLTYVNEIISEDLLGKAVFDTQAGIRQLLISTKKPLDPLQVLTKYYEATAS